MLQQLHRVPAPPAWEAQTGKPCRCSYTLLRHCARIGVEAAQQPLQRVWPRQMRRSLRVTASKGGSESMQVTSSQGMIAVLSPS